MLIYSKRKLYFQITNKHGRCVQVVKELNSGVHKKCHMDLKYQKPSVAWRSKVSEDGLFTATRINATDKILDTFLDNLSISKDNTDIWKSIEKVVKAFNKLNKSEDYFIDLPEREALVDYIQTEAEKAGLKFAGDVTEEWRDEW